jgi:hydrogenase-1 operon protein HyaF
MHSIKSIPVRVEDSGSDVPDWGNALPILHEIRHGLKRLVETGENTLIDLKAIPFGPGDEERLLSLLGRGEIEATLDALGPSRIRETSIPGVWVVDHRNADDERIALHIEITTVPEILRTQPQDLQDAVAALDARIAAGTRK